jgi:uncharacterized protein YbcC (UPF0753/DUF2309 family)
VVTVEMILVMRHEQPFRQVEVLIFYMQTVVSRLEATRSPPLVEQVGHQVVVLTVLVLQVVVLAAQVDL